MSEGLGIALITAAGVMLAPLLLAILNDGLKARRERIAERTKAREREASALMRAHRDALAAKDREIESVWRIAEAQARRAELAERQLDGWYGQRSQS